MSQVFYKNTKTGTVACYDSEEQRKQHGLPDLVKMSAAEVKAHINPPAETMTREQVESTRLAAYANPYTGSDRFQIEAAAERMKGNEVAAKVPEQKWIARRAEIASENPWPEAE